VRSDLAGAVILVAKGPCRNLAARRIAIVIESASLPFGRGGSTTIDVAADVDPTEARLQRRELQRLIAMSFSAGELSKFAERWRVFTDREGAVDDGARTLVRAVDARGKLAALVESLRAHKSLVEWPDVAPAPQAAPEPQVSSPVTPAATEAQEPAEAPAGDEAAPASKTKEPGQPLIDPFVADELAADSSEHRPIVPLPAIVGGVALLSIGLGAFGMWALSGDDEPSAAAPAAEPGLAALAAGALRRSVDGVRQACKSADDDSARGVLTAAFQTCSVPQIRPGVLTAPIPTRPPPPADPQPVTPANPVPPPARAPACLDHCHEVYVGCKQSECGREPSSASDYDTYQRCLQTCANKHARCRLTCR
jgi:hypothetical protein